MRGFFSSVVVSLVQIAAGEGLFSGDTSLVVDSWDSQIESRVTAFDKETKN